MSRWQVIGIDPAPSKDAVVYDSGGWKRLAPRAIRDFLTERFHANSATLVAWDAPLSFGLADLYDRPVDKVVRAWAKDQLARGRFAESAVNARCFAGLPHWVVSCLTLGFPFGSPPSGLQLTPFVLDASQPGPLAVEVHPAVAIGAWWLSSGCAEPLPRYKGSEAGCKKIASTLEFPDACATNDDFLDSFVAYRLGELLVSGEACWVGSPTVGGYIMPRCSATAELQERFSRSHGAA